MLYVLAVIAVPIALMCAMLIMEGLERRVLGLPVPADEDRRGSAPGVPPSATAEAQIVAEPPKAA